MPDLCQSARNSVAMQHEMFCLAERDHGLSLKVLSLKTKIPQSTLQGWAKDPSRYPTAQMPAWALFKLGRDGGVPDKLLSLVAEPFERHVATDEDGEGDLDTAADDADELATEVRRARHPKSPGGTVIVPQERSKIVQLARKAAASSRRAVG